MTAPARAVRQWTLAAIGLAGLAALTGRLAAFAPSVSSFYGLRSAGLTVDAGLPAARVVAIGAAAVGTSQLLVAAVLAPGDPEGAVSAQGYTALRAARWWWLVAALAAASVGVLTVLENAGAPAGRLLADPVALVVGVAQIQPAGGWLVSAAIALLVAMWAGATLSWRGSVAVLMLGLAALLPAALTTSTDAQRSHDIAGDALALHVLASLLWLASTLAVVLTGDTASASSATYRRHAVLAGWCLLVVGGSGVVSAAYAVGPVHLLDSGYGIFVLVSAVALLGLAVPVTARLRARAVGRPFRSWRGRALASAGVELGLLVCGSSVGTGLTRLLPPIQAGYQASRYVYLIGYDLNVPVTALDLVIRWRPDLVFGPLAVLGAGFYLAGLRRVHRAGAVWPRAYTWSWLGGCAVVLVATSSGLATYAPAVFSAHMVQHMLLATVAPALLVLGHGATLAVETIAPTVRPRLESLIDSPGMRLVRGTLVAPTAVAATLFGLYPTGVFAAILQQHWAHLAMNTAFLATGLGVFWAVLGLTPERAGRGLPPLGKVVVVFALMGLHAGFSVWLLTRPEVVAGGFYASLQPAPRPNLLADQRLGAILGWALGELPVILAVIVLLRRWSAEDRTPDTSHPAPAAPGDGRSPVGNSPMLDDVLISELDPSARKSRRGQ